MTTVTVPPALYRQLVVYVGPLAGVQIRDGGGESELRTPPLTFVRGQSKSRRRWDVEEGLRLWVEGVPPKEIGHRMGVTDRAIHNARQALGWPDRPRRYRGPAWDVHRAEQLIHEGVALKDVAASMGVPYHKIYYMARKRGWPRRRWTRRTGSAVADQELLR